mgnify:CR=1 FL=1
MRLRPFILCFNRTAISIQKIDSKSSKSHLKSLPRISPKSYRHRLYLKPFLIAIFNFSHKRPTFAFTGESGYTLGFRRRIAHSGLHAETGGVSDGGGITTLGAFRTFTNIPGPGIRTANFAAFGSWPGCSRRTQKAFGTAMRLCASLSRGVAAPLGCVICLQLGDVAVFSLCAQYFLNVRGRGVLLPSACFTCC